MPHDPLTAKYLKGVLMAACAALVVVAGSAGMACAQADDDEDVPYDTKIIRGVMKGLGLKRDGDEPGIEYRERSPLVVPPSITLPPPENAAPVPNVANWPDDPDERRRKEAKAARKKAALTRRSFEDDAKVLSQKDLTPGAGTPEARRHPKPQSGRGTAADDNDAPGRQLSVFDLGYKGDMFSLKSIFGSDDRNETAKFEGEPPRASLTEPPTGYRTPSPAQPYGLGSKDKKSSKPTDIFERQTPIEDRSRK